MTRTLTALAATLLTVTTAIAQNTPSQTDTLARSQSLTHVTVKQCYRPALDGMGMGMLLNNTSVLNLRSNPLLVVDGIPLTNLDDETIDYTTLDLRALARLASIAPGDIESVTVPDNESSKALYGVQAVNGVILITTWPAKNGNINVDYSFSTSLAKQQKGYDVLNGDQYTMLIRQALYNPFHNESAGGNLRELMYNASYSDFNNYNKNTDWQQAITQTGVTNRHQLSVSGTRNKLGFRLSSGIEHGMGTVIGTGQKLVTHRLSLAYDITKGLKATLGAELSKMSDNKAPAYTNMSINEMAAKKMANQSIYQYDANNIKSDNYFMPNNPIDHLPNMVAYAKWRQQEHDDNRINPTFSLAYRPNKYFSYLFDASFLQRKNNTYDINPVKLNSIADITSTSDYKYKEWYTQNNITLTPVQSTNHRLSASAVFQTRNNFYEYNSYFKPRHLFLSASYLALNRYGIEVSTDRYYDIKLKGRTDFKPSATARWVVSREGFMEPLGFINDLTIEASYGETQGFEMITYMQSNTRKKLSINLAMFKHINITLNKYAIHEEAYGVLFGQYSTYAPYNKPTINLIPDYTYYNDKGWEMNAAAKIVETANFGIDINLNLFANRHTESWDTDMKFERSLEQEGNGIYGRRLEKNKPMGDITGYRFKGVYATGADVVARDANGQPLTNANGAAVYMTYGNGTSMEYPFEAGDAIYEDMDHNGTIDANDTEKLGNAAPKLSGCGGTTLRYRNVCMGIFFNFRYGNDIVNTARMELENMYTFNNQTTATQKRWRKEGDQSNVPRALYQYGYNWLGSDRYVEDGTFVRVKAITLQYEFKERLLKRLRLKELSCYATCRNPFTFTGYSGVDPDIYIGNDWKTMGTDHNYTPIDREFTFGINVGI